LEPKELDKAGLAQWPMVIWAASSRSSISTVKPGDIVIDGTTPAQIYLGKTTKWNDPGLKALNPKLNLPDLPIVAIHRAHGSGAPGAFVGVDADGV
jgi:phosphate transport system substrate-binding protein